MSGAPMLLHHCCGELESISFSLNHQDECCKQTISEIRRFIEKQDKATLVSLICDLYSISPQNRNFLETRFIPASGGLEKYKKIVENSENNDKDNIQNGGGNRFVYIVDKLPNLDDYSSSKDFRNKTSASDCEASIKQKHS
jgi:hypothetical protein